MNTPQPKKHHHRSHTRTPKLYRWADIGTEALIYFTILWGPWAFGTVHDWAILTMNLANYGIGALLLTKWAIRYTTGYYPPRWTTQKNGQSTTLPPKRDWRTKTVAALTIYMLGYILISILNVRATFNHEFNFFENYNENYIQWLPHTYDKSATIQSFLNFLGLTCCFWGIRDWLLGKTRKERMDTCQPVEEASWFSEKEASTPSIPIRLNRLLWLLCISGGLLALIGIIQRLDGTPKLLWIYERERFGESAQSFGPFGYRSNGATYLNMVLPITFGLLMWAMLSAKSKHMLSSQKGSESHYMLIPAICMMISAPFVSLSRGGFVVLGILLMVGILLILFKPNLLKGRQRLSLAMLIVAGIGLSNYIGWEPLMNRMNRRSPWHETQIVNLSYGETINYQCSMPSPPYDNEIQLFHISDSKLPKYRKAFYNVTVLKNGDLKVILFNQKNRSYISTVYTNFIHNLNDGTLDLQLSRKSSSLTVSANSVSLSGYEESSGKHPIWWSHPIIPNEIYVQKRAIVKTGQQDLESKYLRIQLNSLPKNDHPHSQQDFYEINFENAAGVITFISSTTERGRIYEDAWRMAKDYGWLGCGAGAWSSVYFLYHDADEVWDAWVHCDWLEYWITFGIFGSFPGLSFFALTMTANQNQLKLPCINWLGIGLNLAIIGCLIHALFDFPLQVISIMHLFVILCVIKMVTAGNHIAIGKTNPT